jgi:hypothetical protein
MKNETFDMYVPRIYAAHGKTVPTLEILRELWERIQGLPDAFLPWATAKLADYEKLPGNLGRELAGDLYSAWQLAHRNRGYEPKGCPNCDTSTPGWFFGWREDGSARLCKCTCNTDSKFADYPSTSLFQLHEQGLMTKSEYSRRLTERYDSGARPTRLKWSDIAATVAAMAPAPAPTGIIDAFFTGPLYDGPDEIPF